MRNVCIGGLGAMEAQCHHSLHKDSPVPKVRRVLITSQGSSLPRAASEGAPQRGTQPFQSTYHVSITEVSVLLIYVVPHSCWESSRKTRQWEKMEGPRSSSQRVSNFTENSMC